MKDKEKKMKVLRFVGEDIGKMKYRYGIITLQIIVGLVLFCYIYQVSDSFAKTTGMVQNRLNNEEIYMFRDNTSDKKIDKLLKDDKKLKDMKKWYAKVQKTVAEDSNLQSYIADTDSDINIKRDEYINNVVVSENFMDIYQIEGDFSKTKWKEEFFGKSGNAEEIPVIVGYNLSKKYTKGKVFMDTSRQKYKVIGSLKKGSVFVEPSHSKKYTSLDNCILSPYHLIEDDSMEYWSYVQSVYFVTNHPEKIQKCIVASKKMGLYDLSLLDFSYQLQCIKEDAQDTFAVYGMFLLVTVAFCIVGIIGNMIQFINDNKKEFAIHLIVGASIKEIVGRVILLATIQILIGLAVVAVIFGVNKYFCVTAIFASMFMIATMVYPILFLKRQSIRTILRRSYE